MLRNVLTVGGWTMASRVLGFARDMLIAATLGAGPVADAFLAALKLPNLFRRLFGEGAFNAAFVPAFSGLLAAEGRPAAHRFAEETFAVMAFWLGALTILGEVFMPRIVAVLVPGFAAIPAKFALTVTLSRITFPYLLLICLAALVSGMLNGLERFTAAAASYLLFNVISIAALLWLTPYVPTAGHALAWGITASGVVQLAVLLWAAQRAGMRLRLPLPRLTPQVRVLLRRMLPGLVGAGVTQLNLAVDVIIASLLPPGTVSVLYYADRVQQLPLGVIGTAVGTALLPLLSRQVRAGEAQASIGTLNRAIEYALFLTLPAALALVVAAWPVMSVLFGRGAFDPGSVRLSAQSLAAYAVGLPAFVLVKVVAPGFFARGDMATPVRIGVAAVALNLAMNVVFNLGCIVSSLGVALPGAYAGRLPALANVGPALATSLAAMFNVGCLGIVLARRGYLRPDAQLRRRVARMLAAAGAMGLALAAAQHVLFAAPLHGLARFAALAALVVVGMAVYGAAALAFGAADWAELRRMMTRRRRRMEAGAAADTAPRP
ncbi:MAG TPA: murein biosynthesis integral membrane protein MurJ [Acetobacteraceae bacterium]|nr:murein biosynthesis integral membrane protein MurJ [Acetobacteraceae bacterium]